MSVSLRHKFRIFAASLLLAITTGLALSSAAVPVVLLDQPYVSVAPQNDGGPAPVCFERHSPFERDALATAPVDPAFVYAIPAAGFIKAVTPLRVQSRRAAPHLTASVSILFRNFRE